EEDVAGSVEREAQLVRPQPPSAERRGELAQGEVLHVRHGVELVHSGGHTGRSTGGEGARQGGRYALRFCRRGSLGALAERSGSMAGERDASANEARRASAMNCSWLRSGGPFEGGFTRS